MVELANLQVVVGADTSQAERGLDSLGSKVSSTGSAIQTALGGALIGATAALGAAFVASAKSAADFEKQMSAVSAVSGASAAEMQTLTAAALQLGKDTSFSASEAATGIEELIKAGVSVADVMGGGARAALDLAAAGAISVGDAAEIASNAMNVFGLKGADMAHVADVIAGAANASAIGVTDYKFSLAAAGAVAATVGVSFEDLSTAIAVMGQAGIKGSDAGTSLKTMLLNLQPATKAQNAEFRRLGIVTAEGANQFFDATGKAKSMAEIAQVLQTSMAGMTKQQQLASLEILFGSDAIRAGAVLLKAGAAGFDEMAESMGKVTAQAVANERLNNLWGSVEKLKGSLETAAIILGSMFTPALKDMADVVTDVVNEAIEIIEQLPDAWRTVGEAFAGAWEPSATLTPFMNAVGLVGIAVRQMVDLAMPYIVTFGEVVTRVMSGDIKGAFDQFVVLVGSIGALLAPILLSWGQQFIDWVAPMIPPFLAAVADIGLQLTTWIAAQIPLIAAQLLLWAEQFIAWVAPFIPPLLEALGRMLADMLTWLGTQVATIATALYQWFTSTIAAIDWAGLATSTGALLGTMVGQAIVSLAQSGPIIAEWLTTITQTLASVDWNTIGTTTGELMVTMTTAAIGLIVGAAMVLAAWTNAFVSTLKAITWEDVKTTLGALLTAMITATLGLASILNAFTTGFVTAIVKGITGMSPSEAISALGAWVQGVIDKAVAAIKFTLPMPSFGGGGGGGGTGATPLSYTGGGDSESKLQRAYQIALSKGFTQDQANAMLGTLRVEGGLQGAVGDSGQSHGPFQLYEQGQFPRFAAWLQQQGIAGDPKQLAKDIELSTSFALDNYYGAALRQGSALGLSGPELATYAQRHGQVSINPEKAGGAYGPPAGGGGAPMYRVPLGGGGMPGGLPGGDPSHWPVLMDQTVSMVPDWVAAMAEISTSGQMTFGSVGTAGAAAGTALVSTSTDSLGNVTRIYSEAGAVVGATITDAAGAIVNTWGTMATGVTEQSAGMSTGVVASTNLMASGALTSVTNLGSGILTSVSDSAGTTIATVTDMQGQVTSQYATLANGVSLTMGDMAAGVLTSTTDLGTGVMTTVQDLSGNYITTITDLSGNVTSQYTTMGTEVAKQAGIMNTEVTAETATMATNSLTSVTDLGDGVLTITRDTNGEMVATVSDMSGRVVDTYTTMGSDVTGAVEDLGLAVVEQLGDVVSAFEDTTGPIDGFQEALESVEPPDFGDIIDELEDVKEAAEDAADAIKDINSADKGGSKGGKSGLGKKAAGGWTIPGQMTLVGERGPEVISTTRPMFVTPNHQLGGGGNTYITLDARGAQVYDGSKFEDMLVSALGQAHRGGRITRVTL